MRFRAAHLAYVLLLLSTLGAADTHAQGDQYGRCGQHIRILLQQGTVAGSEDAFPHSFAEALTAALPVASAAHIRSAWTMRPPAAHSVAQHAATGSGL